nr:unnamed protein product [Spirometra erinaceieuropaei]
MALNTKPPDFEEMNILQLKQALEQQLFLLNKMGNRLPDSGEKLTKSVARLKFLISKREKQMPPSNLPEIQPNPSPRPSQRHGQKLLTARGGRYSSPNSAPANCTATESELDSLTSTLSILNIKPENPVLSLDSENCQDEEVPRLSADEVRAWRRACNLPTWNQDQGFRWFTFRLRRLTTDLVSLTVLDCHRPDRVFARVGALSTWPILTKTSPSGPKKTSDTFVTLKSHNYSPTTKVTVSEAVSDLWCFLGDLLKGDQQQQGAPVLLCASPSTAEHAPDTSEEDDFVRFRRLFVAARHRLSARSGMPRDLLMMVTGSKDEAQSSRLSQPGLDEEDALAAEANACRALRDRLFAAPSSGEATLRPGGFSALEFFSKNELRTCVWLEAPLNLFVLRKIAVPPDEVDSNPPFVPKTVSPRETHNAGSPHSVSVPARPLEVEDVVLRRLAATGFCSSSLAFLAGTGGWRGFAGLLSAPAVWGLPIENNSQPDSGPLRPLVTANRCLLRRLYAHFRRVYKGLVLNASQYEETGNRVKPWSSANSKAPEDLKWAPGSAASIVGWTGAPAGLAPRQLQTLSIQESIDLMDRVRQDYLALGLVLNASQYEEAGNRVKPWSSANSKAPEDLKWAPGSAASIVGWTGAPAGLAPRQLQTLSIQESIDLMDRVRQDYLALWRKLNLPTLPQMPPESVLSQKYRETTALDTDDDAETLSADESDRETVIGE